MITGTAKRDDGKLCHFSDLIVHVSKEDANTEDALFELFRLNGDIDTEKLYLLTITEFVGTPKIHINAGEGC